MHVRVRGQPPLCCVFWKAAREEGDDISVQNRGALAVERELAVCVTHTLTTACSCLTDVVPEKATLSLSQV